MSFSPDPASNNSNYAPDNFILVVDDEPANLSLLKETLSSTGYKIRVVTNGLKALEIIHKQPPVLVLLDVSMPGIDGFETCRRIKHDLAMVDLPIMFATASNDINHKVKGFTLGAVDYITKPFQVEEVLARVQVQLKLQQLTTTLRHKNQQLKQEVTTRMATEAALQQTNQRLEESIEELKNAQVQLVQNEKMSSLGHLVAGVAHEINNPVNFIYGNLEPAQYYCKSLINLVNRYRQEYPEPSPELQDYIHEIDLDFLTEDLSKLLDSLYSGADRIRKIILSLRNFSRLDQAKVKTVDIHEGIDSTLLILKSRLNCQLNKSAIEVEKHYGDIPPIECYPSQLNQVFMNILANAIDAIEDYNEQRHLENLSPIPGKIQITTEVSQTNHLLIHISDNGPGIPEDIQSKLFDPFFTTKPVGKGTGLGLSISYQIITEKHGGQLTQLSKPDQGTLFTISLPIANASTMVCACSPKCGMAGAAI